MRYLALLVIILLSPSCKKGQADFVLKGTVTDLTFNQNLSGATIKLYQVPVGTAQQKLIGISTLEADGSYSFTFPRDKMEKYVIIINKTNYFNLPRLFLKFLTENIGSLNLLPLTPCWLNL